ncbi:MAG TPA: Nudix family hydrolase [Pseudomonadales bacterium]|nr:Nudix family hydrolase [Pseudomonadales bacterium]
MKVVHVAVAIIENHFGEILVAKRPDHLHMGGFWEFPGGKLEPGETVLGALRREIREELALEVHDAAPFLKIPYQYPDKKVLLDVWLVIGFSGQPQGREGQEIRWVKKNKLRELEFPPANRHIFTALSLPDRLLVTGGFIDMDDCKCHIEHAITVHGIRAIQLRAHHLGREEYSALARCVMPLCDANGVALLLNTSVDGFVQGAGGIHLSGTRLLAQEKRPIPDDVLLGASCHNEAEVAHACNIGVDYICLSPVLPTISHPGQMHLGWAGFSSLIANCPVPVFALGGIADVDLHRAKAAGAYGIAAISAWW